MEEENMAKFSDCDSSLDSYRSDEDDEDVDVEEKSRRETSVVLSGSEKGDSKSFTEEKGNESVKNSKKQTTPFSVLDILGPGSFTRKSEDRTTNVYNAIELLNTKAHGMFHFE